MTETGLQIALPYILAVLGCIAILVVVGVPLLILSGLSGVLRRLGGRFERFEYRVRAWWSGPRRTREALRIAWIHEWEERADKPHPDRLSGELAKLERIVALAGKAKAQRGASQPHP
jgi:hypothetical protein